MSKRIETWLLIVLVVAGFVVLVGEVVDGHLVRSLLWLAAVLFFGTLVLRARRAQEQ